MKLSSIHPTVVERDKITAYLLSEETSGGKAEFFIGFGFSTEQWEALRNALLQHIEENDIARSMRNPYGTKYIIEGELRTPDRRNPYIRSVWIVEIGKEVARFVTAYPLERASDD